MVARVVAIVVLAVQVAAAQTPPPDDSKLDAKALMQSGVKLLEAHDYLGALSVFKSAYARFPSARILLNIGTTQKLLMHDAEAANVYQRYLDSPDADPARHDEVASVLAELDTVVGRLEIAVTPADAEIQLGDDWLPAKAAHVQRITPGGYKVSARRDDYQPAAKSGFVLAGDKVAVAIDLVAIPKPVIKPVTVTPHGDDERIHAELEPTGPRSRFGALAVVHVSVVPKLGSAAFVGGTADVTEQLAIDAALILGPGLVSSGMYATPPPKLGAYAGASFAFLQGKLRPRASAGIPVFFSGGARFSLRAAGGVEYVQSRHLAVMFDLGLEVEINPEHDIHYTALVPALSASGRL